MAGGRKGRHSPLGRRAAQAVPRGVPGPPAPGRRHGWSSGPMETPEIGVHDIETHIRRRG